MSALEIALWVCVGLIAYTHAGYPLLLAAIARLREGEPTGHKPPRQ